MAGVRARQRFRLSIHDACIRAALQRIYLISTGGTIERVYSEQTGTVENLATKIDRYFRLLRLPDADVKTIPLMNKDSLEMTDEDRRSNHTWEWPML